MSRSRRDLLSSITAVSVSALLVAHARPAMAQPTSAALSGAPLRLPLHEFVQNQTLLDALRRGVEVMRSRPPSDPRSWFFQSAVHAVKDGLLADAILQDFRVARVDQKTFWNKCPHFPGVNSADFLPWHRAYLYYSSGFCETPRRSPRWRCPIGTTAIQNRTTSRKIPNLTKD